MAKRVSVKIRRVKRGLTKAKRYALGEPRPITMELIEYSGFGERLFQLQYLPDIDGEPADYTVPIDFTSARLDQLTLQSIFDSYIAGRLTVAMGDVSPKENEYWEKLVVESGEIMKDHRSRCRLMSEIMAVSCTEVEWDADGWMQFFKRCPQTDDVLRFYVELLDFHRPGPEAEIELKNLSRGAVGTDGSNSGLRWIRTKLSLIYGKIRRLFKFTPGTTSAKRGISE